MTKQEIYEQIVQLTSELHTTNVAEKIFSVAKEGYPKRVEEVFETFKKENPDLYVRIASLGIKFSKDMNTESKTKIINVFSSEKGKENGSYVFDTNIINAVDLYILLLLSGIDEFYLFNWGTESSKNLVKAIENAGYIELADFVDNWSICDHVGEGEKYQNIYECLVGIFKGEFK